MNQTQIQNNHIQDNLHELLEYYNSLKEDFEKRSDELVSITDKIRGMEIMFASHGITFDKCNKHTNTGFKIPKSDVKLSDYPFESTWIKKIHYLLSKYEWLKKKDIIEIIKFHEPNKEKRKVQINVTSNIQRLLNEKSIKFLGNPLYKRHGYYYALNK